MQNAFYVWSPGLALRFGLIPLRWSGPTVKKEDHPFGWSSFACVLQNLVFEAILDSVSDDKYFFLMIIKVSEFHLQFHEQSQFVMNVLRFTYKKC